MRYWRRRPEPFDLEAELKASRPEPSSEFVHQLEARVKGSGRTRAAGSLRVAFVGALTAVMLIALAGVGGVGYASSAARDAAVSVKRVVSPEQRVVRVLKKSPAISQYGHQPAKAKKKKTTKAKKAKKAKKGQGAKGRVRSRVRPPFTG
jgi:hypothetical protein